MPSFHDDQVLDDFRRRHKIQPGLLKKLRTRFYRRLETPGEVASELGTGLAEALLAEVDFEPLRLVERQDSQLDGASKLVFETGDAMRLETVILRVETGRTALCVSSQVGCAADCVFCATGRMGIRRNLTAAEIVAQLAAADRLLKPEERRVRNLVFMGMGEPFHNEDEVHRALDMLVDGKRFGLAPGRVTVSTVGIPDAMLRLAHRLPAVNIALSLHAARQEVREQIIPLAKKYDLPSLKEAIREINALQGRPFMIEYLMLAGLNDREEDLQALIDFGRGLDLHFNLIPFNAVEGTDGLEPTPRAEREAFGARLRAEGYQVTLRYSLGSDVAAACGQLVREEEKRRRDEARLQRELLRAGDRLPWAGILDGGFPLPGSERFKIEELKSEGDELVARVLLEFDEAPIACCGGDSSSARARIVTLSVRSGSGRLDFKLL